LPEIRAFSMQLVAYLAAFLPVAPYFRANDPRITGVCDDQYTSTLESLETSTDERFKDYITRKTQAWFGRWGRNVAVASPAASPGGAGGAPGPASTPARLPAQAPAMSDSDSEDDGDSAGAAVDGTRSPIVELQHGSGAPSDATAS